MTVAVKRSMYTNRQRMLYEACPCDDYAAKPPAQWILDKIAEEQMTQGWNVRRSNICPGCRETCSVNGKCAC